MSRNIARTAKIIVTLHRFFLISLCSCNKIPDCVISQPGALLVILFNSAVDKFFGRGRESEPVGLDRPIPSPVFLYFRYDIRMVPAG